MKSNQQLRKINIILIFIIFISSSINAQIKESWWPEQKLPKSIVRVSPINLAQRNLVQSVAGLAAKSVNNETNDELVWTNVSGTAYNYYLTKWLGRTSVIDNGNIAIWDLVDRFKFKNIIKGYVLYNEGDYSVNFATIYSSIYDAVLIEASLESTAIAHGLELKYDARSLNTKDSYTQFWFDGIKSSLNNKMIVTIDPNDYRQREMAISNGCMVYWGVDNFYNTILSWMEPNSPVVGWNESEGPAVVACSKYGMFTTGATIVNLSILSAGAKQLVTTKAKNINPKGLNFSTGKSYHSFVLSDGDNMMIQGTSLPLTSEYWSNQDINNVPMSWTNCPVNLSEMLPDAWNYFVDKSTVPGSFVEFGGGYQFPDYFAQSKGADATIIQREFASIVNKRMKATGTKVFGFITRNSVSSSDALAAYQIYADSIDDLVGIVAIQYIPYNAGGGKVFWITNKKGKHIPVFTAKYQMWSGLNQYSNSGNPSVIANLINSTATNSSEPTIDWTIVHAWSYFKKDADGNISDATSNDTGALRGVTPTMWSKSLLNPNVEVVSIEELLWRLRMKNYPEETQSIIDNYVSDDIVVSNPQSFELDTSGFLSSSSTEMSSSTTSNYSWAKSITFSPVTPNLMTSSYCYGQNISSPSYIGKSVRFGASTLTSTGVAITPSLNLIASDGKETVLQLSIGCGSTKEGIFEIKVDDKVIATIDASLNGDSGTNGTTFGNKMYDFEYVIPSDICTTNSKITFTHKRTGLTSSYLYINKLKLFARAMPLTSRIMVNNNVICNGGADGSATVIVNGGAPEYSYSWTPSGGTEATASGLIAGNYTCTVKDAMGVVASETVTITQPEILEITSETQTNILCKGSATGEASVSVSGGTGQYTYDWTPGTPIGDGTSSVTGLSSGTWTCTVTDINGCVISKSFNITEPNLLKVEIASQANVSCKGEANGSATVVVTGGTPNYTYLWSPIGGTDATASGLSAGTYTVKVKDANSCETIQSIIITEPKDLEVSAVYQTNVLCNGNSNGQASVEVSGGAGEYTYDWSPGTPIGDGTSSVSGLSAGIWTCTVTDSNLCSKSVDFEIVQSDETLTILSASQTDNLCSGSFTGTASVNVSGGTGEYIYDWSPGTPIGEGTSSVSGLSAGAWTCTIADKNSGCIIEKEFNILEPEELSFVTTSLLDYEYNQLYNCKISVSGGSGEKSFIISSGSLPLGITLAANGILSGISTQISNANFTIKVTDINGCNKFFNFNLKLSQIPITVKAKASQTKVYGSIDPVFSYTVTPDLLPGDSFTGSLNRELGENVGKYAINQGTLSAGVKYLITYVGENFEVTAKPIIVTADISQTKVYGTTDPEFTYSVSPNLVSGDSFFGYLSRDTGEDAGFYAITKGSLSAGLNYKITYTGANFNIIKANQSINWEQILDLGCNGETSILLTASSSSGLPITYISSDPNIASISNTLLEIKDKGDVTISAFQEGNNNFNPTVIDKLLMIKQPNLVRKQFEDIIFFDNSSKRFKTFSWYKNNVLVDSEKSQFYKERGVLDGVYYAKAITYDGRVITTCPLVFSPTLKEEHVKIIPNPVKPGANFELNSVIPSVKLKNASVEIYSLEGVLLESKIINEDLVSFSAPIVEGIYIVKLTLSNGKIFTKNLLVKN